MLIPNAIEHSSINTGITGMVGINPSTFAISVFGLSLLVGLVLGAIYSFAQIQSWMNDVNHKQFNEEWFSRFEKNMSDSYEDPDLKWRYHALDNMWAPKDK